MIAYCTSRPCCGPGKLRVEVEHKSGQTCPKCGYFLLFVKSKKDLRRTKKDRKYSDREREFLK